MYLPPITLQAHEDEHEASSTFLSVFSSPIFYAGHFCQYLFPSETMPQNSCCVRMSVWLCDAMCPASPPPQKCEPVSQLICRKSTNLKMTLP